MAVGGLTWPDRGDLVRMDFDPGAGHEQSGRRPALVLTPYRYHAKTHLGIVCPITTKTKGYAFEVEIEDAQSGIHGVVLADQVKNVDLEARSAEIVGQAPDSVVQEVLKKLTSLFGLGMV